MHFCPKCSAYYADGLPPFCRIDGMPLVSVDPASDEWNEGSLVIKEKASALTRQKQKLKWRRIWSIAVTTLITIAAMYVLVATGFIGIERVRTVYKISGVVSDGSKPLAGVKIAIEGDPDGASTTTDAAGKYSFTNLLASSSYTISPSTTGKITFTPQSHSINNLMKDEAADFSAVVKPDVYRISGQVRESGTSKSRAGIEILLIEGARRDSRTTDINGNYFFNDLPADRNYTVSPIGPSKFKPGSLPFPHLEKDGRADFEIVSPVYTIAGVVTGHGHNRVTIKLRGPEPKTIETDRDGRYAFTNLPATGPYTVIPMSPTLQFNPSKKPFGSLTRDEQFDFAAVSTPVYKIAGRVTGQGHAGVEVTLSRPLRKEDKTKTDADGNYVFPNLPATGPYTVTPQSETMKFQPIDKAFPRLLKDESVNFELVPLDKRSVTNSTQLLTPGKPPLGTSLTTGRPKAAPRTKPRPF